MNETNEVENYNTIKCVSLTLAALAAFTGFPQISIIFILGFCFFCESFWNVLFLKL